MGDGFLADVKSFPGFSDADAHVIRNALEIFLDSPEQVIINGVPVLKTDAYSSICQKLPYKGVQYTVAELIVIKGCMSLYRKSLPWFASRRIHREIQIYLTRIKKERIKMVQSQR